MTTNSYPAVGTDGLLESEWSKMYGSRDGIIEDYHTGGVAAFNLTLNDATNEATVGVGSASVNGYVLEVTAGEVLSVPAAIGSPVTYYIAAKYDPALNVAGGGGASAALGPCRLVIGTSLSTAAGEVYVLLYSITRSPSQVLTLAARVDYRRWIGPTVTLPDYPAVQPTGFGPFPRGSVAIETAVNGITTKSDVSIMTPNAAGTALAWASLFQPAAVAFPAAAGLVAFDAPPQMIRFAGGMVHLRGNLKRSNGAALNTGSTVTLGTLPAGWRPYDTMRWWVRGSAGVFLYIDIFASGVVSMPDPPGTTNTSLICLDSVVFRAEN